MYLPILRVYKKKRSVTALSDDAYVMYLCVCVCVFSSDFLYKSKCCGFSFELHRQARSSLIWVCTVCTRHFVSLFGVRNFRTFTVSHSETMDG